MPISSNEKQALNALKGRFLKKYSILDFRLFGSKAKGSDVEGSDIDVMIVLEDLSPLIESQIDER